MIETKLARNRNRTFISLVEIVATTSSTTTTTSVGDQDGSALFATSGVSWKIVVAVRAHLLMTSQDVL